MNDCFIGCFFVPNFASQSNQKRVEIAVLFETLSRKKAAPQQSQKRAFALRSVCAFFDLLTQRNTGNGNRFPNDIMTVVLASWNFVNTGGQRIANPSPAARHGWFSISREITRTQVRTFINL
jgi:hypothetical protein